MNTNYQLKTMSAAFTGHRNLTMSRLDQVKADLHAAIIAAYENGYRNFYCGMAMGFDLLAAETICMMKADYPDMELTAVVPCPEQCDRFSYKDKFRYAKMLHSADHIVTISQNYYSRCFLDRNDFMIEHSSLLIAFYQDGKKGGTGYTVRKAKAKRLRVVNIFN